jgi:glutamine synthetase
MANSGLPYPIRCTADSCAQIELPGNLRDALDELEKDDLVRETLGDHIFEHFLEAKREEWHDYIKQVSPWEVGRYLSLY